MTIPLGPDTDLQWCRHSYNILILHWCGHYVVKVAHGGNNSDRTSRSIISHSGLEILICTKIVLINHILTKICRLKIGGALNY